MHLFEHFLVTRAYFGAS